MRINFIQGVIALIAFASLPCASLAEDEFHIHYRVTNLSEDANSLSGTLFLNVYNTSGEDDSDMVACIPGPNQITYDQHHIGVGDLADGAQVEVLDPFIVPIEITHAEPAAEPVSWRLEYTNPLGVRQSIDVVGLEAQ
jgi:hypothetical protein